MYYSFVLQMGIEELKTLVLKNKGQHDMVWLLYFGASGDKMVNTLLPIICGDDEECGRYTLQFDTS